MSIENHPLIKIQDLPPEAEPEVNTLLKTLKQKYEGQKITEQTKIKLNNEVSRLNEYINKKYVQQEPITCKLEGPLAYTEEEWTLTVIKNMHKKYCPHHTDKEEYTNIEVNNMLFDLKAYDIIGCYVPLVVPYCFGITIREGYDEIFEGTVKVQARYDI